MPLGPEQNPQVRDDLRVLPPLRLGIPFLFPRQRQPGPPPRIVLAPVDPPDPGGDLPDEPGSFPGVPPPEPPPEAIAPPAPPPVGVAPPPPGTIVFPPAPVGVPAPISARTFPVQLSFDLAADAVAGQAVRSIPGPVLIEHIFVRSTCDIQADDFWSMFRVDFSRDSTVQSLSFADNGAPTGYTPDDRILFEYGAIEDTNNRFNGSSNGWYRILGGSVTEGSFELSIPCSLQLLMDEVFIKVYVQNDAAAVRRFFITLTVRLLSGGEVAPVEPPGPEPIPPPGPPPPPPPPGPPPGDRGAFSFQAQVPGTVRFGAIGSFGQADAQFQAWASMRAHNGRIVRIVRFPDNFVVREVLVDRPPAPSGFYFGPIPGPPTT